jgi:hypothetical protein
LGSKPKSGEGVEAADKNEERNEDASAPEDEAKPEESDE